MHMVSGWTAYVLPALSSIILVVAGIAIGLPSLAGKINKTPRRARCVAAVCFFAAATSFIFDVTARHDSDTEMRRLMGNDAVLLTRTESSVNQTNQLVTDESIFLTQLSTVNVRLSDLDAKIASSRSDPQRTAALQAQVRAAQQEIRDISADALLSLVPQSVNQLRDWPRERFAAEENLRLDKFEIRYRTSTSQELAQNDAYWAQKIKESDARYDEQLSALIANADSLRKIMLQRLSPSLSNHEDKFEAAAFISARTAPKLLDLDRAGIYLTALAKRLSLSAHD